MPDNAARTNGSGWPAQALTPPAFSCARHLAGRGVVRLAVAGELDIATVPELDRALRRAEAEADTELIILDLCALEFMDCSGAHLLRAAERRVSQNDGRLVAVRVPAAVARLLELTGVAGELKLVGHLPAAAAHAVIEGPLSRVA